MWYVADKMCEDINNSPITYIYAVFPSIGEIEFYFDIENAKLGALRRNLADKLNGKKTK